MQPVERGNATPPANARLDIDGNTATVRFTDPAGHNVTVKLPLETGPPTVATNRSNRD